MKNIKWITTFFFCFLYLSCSIISVQALGFSELPPKVNVVGMDTTKYEIQKTISEDDVIVSIAEKGTDIKYSWRFEKAKITDEITLNFELQLASPNQSKIDHLAGTDQKMYLSFTHHGTLPSSATIEVYVGNQYANGEKLYLYYYNEEEEQIEYVSHNLKVKDGYVSFKIDHCSDYFLTTTIVNDAVNNPQSMNYIIIILVAIVFILIGTTIFSTKK